VRRSMQLRVGMVNGLPQKCCLGEDASEHPPSASFLKSGIHKRMAEPPSGKGGDRGQTTARPPTPEHRARAKVTQTCRKSPRSRRLDLARARIISLSWQGLRTAKIAEKLGCHPKTVRKRLHPFNAEGIDGLGDRPGAGRKPRITEEERSRIIALVCKDPPGKLLTEPGGGLQPEAETKAAYSGRWTL
jgi:transposase